MKLRDQLHFVLASAHAFNTERAGECLDLVLRGNPYDLMFFSELSDPRWLEQVRKAGMFENLPGTVVRGDRTYYARHVPLIGLAKLAPIAPSEVADILQRLVIPENPQIYDQIMRVIVAVDDFALAPKLVGVLERIFERGWNFELLWLDDILTKWLDGGARKTCFDALTAFLKTLAKNIGEHARYQTWQVDELDRKVISRLGDSEPVEVARSLFEALRIWADADRSRRTKQSREDHSRHEADPDFDYPWTYWLEQFGAVSIGAHNFEATLAQRLYKIGRQIYETNEPAVINQFDEMLRSDRWHLFRRMRWQLYADFPDRTLGFARRDTIERISRMSELAARHGYEFAALLENHSAKHGHAFLAPDEVNQFADAVLKGPVDEKGQQDADYRDRFYRLQLYPVRKLLVGDALRKFNEIVSTTGTADVPPDVYKPFSLSGGEAKTIEHVSPLKEKQLAELSDADLWNFLNTWKPDKQRSGHENWWVEQDAGALGEELAKLIEANPARFQPESEWWKNIRRPEILYKPLERAANQLEQKKDTAIDALTSEWRMWFGIASWITDQSVTQDDTEETAGDWNWARVVVIKFLRAALHCRGAAAGILRDQIGSLLQRLVRNVDVRLTNVEKPMMDDWLTTAINSVRGTAIEALLELGFAQKQDSRQRSPEPWIFELIAERLRSPSESPAVFAILGARLRLVAHLFAESLRPQPQLLLPDDRPGQRISFVVSHFLYDNPATQVIDVLPALPRVALDTLQEAGEPSTSQSRGDFASRLGSHLCFYYWNDLLGEIRTANKLIDRFLETAGSKSRAETIGQIARIFADAARAEHEPLYERVMQLWDYWFARIREAVDVKAKPRAEFNDELNEFVQWLNCSCFPFEWRFRRTLEAIAYMDKLPRSYNLMEALGEFASAGNLEEAIAILHAVAVKGSDEIQWAYSEEQLKPILKGGLLSKNRVTALLSESIQERLLSAGLFEYLDVGLSEAVEESARV
jgi:hypothetical protein